MLFNLEYLKKDLTILYFYHYLITLPQKFTGSFKSAIVLKLFLIKNFFKIL